MKIKLLPSRFYLSNIIFYTCLLACPLSATIEQVTQTEGSKPSITSIINNVDECLEIDKTENSDQKSSLETTKYKQIMASVNKLNKRYDQQEKQMAELQNMLQIAQLQNVLQNIPIDAKGKDQMTSFLYAVEKGQLDIAKLLRQWGVDINAKNAHGNNALHLACLSDNQAMVNWLLDVCNIDIETKGKYQRTPFLCAAKKGQLGMAKLLRQRGADIHAKEKNGDNALHWACWSSGSIEMVTWLLDVCKISLEIKGYAQMTPFLCAAYQGQLGIAKLLRQQGANIYTKDENGDNALHLACLYSGSEAMVTWLLDVCKIGIESKGQYQKTPFLSAAQKGQLGIAKLLRQRGANIHAKNAYGNSALHLACLYSGSVQMTTWLLNMYAKENEAYNKGSFKEKVGIETKGYRQQTLFLCAAKKGQLGIAKLLRQRGANINEKDIDGDNALHLACFFSGSVAMIEWLLDVCKIGIETKGQYQMTPFLSAANKGQLAIAKLLRQRGANINAKDEIGKNALHFACLYSSSIAMVTWLLDVCKIDIESKGKSQKTPFLSAAEKGQLAIAKLLRQRGADINATDEDADNALHLACYFSSSEAMVTWLLDVCKIDIESKGKSQKTPFLCAANKGQLAIAKLLRQRGADINATDEDGDNALHFACYFSGSKEMVTWLLNVCHIDIESKGRNQVTPFLSAAEKGQLAISKLLSQRGANLNARDKNGNNALHFACLFSGSVAMVTWLLNVCHIDIESKGNKQQTPFFSAAQEGQLPIAKLLSQRGANLNARDKNGNNALHIACLFSGSLAMVTWLLDECKIGLETKGYKQQTPFLSAAKKGQLGIAKLLRQRGANIHAKDKDGNNALYLAKYIGNKKMIDYLESQSRIKTRRRFNFWSRWF